MFKFFQKPLKVTYGYDDVTLVPSYSQLKSRSETSTEMHGYSLPIIVSCMDTLGNRKLTSLCVEQKLPYIAHRMFKTPQEQFYHFFPTNISKQDVLNFSLNNKERLNNIWFAVGSVPKHRIWIDYLISMGVRRFCVDMAHGDSKACIDTVKYIKNYDYKDLPAGWIDSCQSPHIIAGNVASLDGFRRLQKAGADGIRCGIGSGAICSTSLQTGFGIPILSNLMDIAPYKKNTWLIADGGVKYTGDIAKAVYFGADFAMIGKMFASTDLATGACYNINKIKLKPSSNNPECLEEYFSCVYPHEFEKKYKIAEELDWKNQDSNNTYKNMCKNNLVYYKEYHGLASRQARKNVLNYASVEGVSGLTKYLSTTYELIQDTKLRLQASLSYGGAKNWNEFRKNVKAVRRSQAGIIAADTHLEITTDR